MKKLFVIIGILVCIVAASTACTSTSKCAAYGYHTQNMEQIEESANV
jgi:hypothetical protein